MDEIELIQQQLIKLFLNEKEIRNILSIVERIEAINRKLFELNLVSSVIISMKQKIMEVEEIEENPSKV